MHAWEKESRQIWLAAAKSHLLPNFKKANKTECLTFAYSLLHLLLECLLYTRDPNTL